jgi:hypothetical protein
MSKLIDELAQAIVSPEAKRRNLAADEVTDVHRRLSSDDVKLLTDALVDALLVEIEWSCQEAELNALVDLKAWHHLDPESVGRLSGIRDRLSPQLIEYLDDILDSDSKPA